MQKEIDLLELGYQPTKCLHGENVVGDEIERISRVAGRAYRAKVEARHRWFERNYGGRTPHRQRVEELDRAETETRIRKLEREKEAALRSLTEYAERSQSERMRVIRRAVAAEKERNRLVATIKGIERSVLRVQR